MDGVNSLRAAEQAGFTYTATSKSGKSAKKKRGVGRFLPFSFAGLVALFAAIFFGAQASLPTLLTSTLTTQTNILSQVTKNAFVRTVSEKVQTGKVSDYLSTRLAKNGVKVSGQNLVFETGETVNAADLTSAYQSNLGIQSRIDDTTLNTASFYYDNAAESATFANRRNVLYGVTKEAPEEVWTIVDNNLSGKIASSSVHPNENGETIDDDNVTISSNSLADGEGIEGATKKARRLANSIAGKATVASSIACSAFRTAGLLATIIQAASDAQNRQIASIFAESFDRSKSGAEAGSVNEIMTSLTKAEPYEYTTYENGKSVTKTITAAGTDSPGFAATFGGDYIDPAKLEYATPSGFTTITNAMLRGTATELKCAAAQAVGSVFSLTTNVWPGGSTFNLAIKLVSKTLVSIAINATVSAIIAFAIPHLIRIFATSFEDSFKGIIKGDVLISGIAATNISHSQKTGGAVPASVENIQAQNKELSRVIGQNAAIDRANRSPFDTTSQNTFLGSIVSKFATIPSGSLLTTVSRFNHVASNDLAKLTTSAYADDQVENVTYLGNVKPCVNNSEIGCELYDHHIAVIDPSIYEISNDDPTYNSVIRRNLNPDGSVRKNSDLEYFIIYYMERESPCGIVDYNILDKLEGGNSVLKNIDILATYQDIINAVNARRNLRIATCEEYTFSDNNPKWESEYRYFQKWINQSRIEANLEAYGGSSNKLVAILDELNENSDQDETFIAYISRISGLSQPQVAYAFEFLEYSNYLAQYDPSTRIGWVEQDLRIPPTEPDQFAADYAIARSADTYITKREALLC